MRVERFFLFFPPKLFSVRRGETEYGIGMIPLGGFVKITGMNPEELEAAERGEHLHKPGVLEQIEGAGFEQRDRRPPSRGRASLPPEVLKRAYYNQPVWKRIVVIAAGPAMNVLIAFLVLFFLALGLQRATALRSARSRRTSRPRACSRAAIRSSPSTGCDRPRAAPGRAHRISATAPTRSRGRSTPIPAPVRRSTAAGRRRRPYFVVRRDGKPVTVKLIPFYDANAPALKEGGPVGRYRVGFGFGEGGFVPREPLGPGRRRSLDQLHVGSSPRRRSPPSPASSSHEQRKQVSGVVGVSDVAHQTIDSAPARR